MARDFTGGSSNLIDVGTFSVVSSAFTMACWVYIDSFSAGRDDRFISKADGTGVANHDWMLGVGDQGGGVYKLRCRFNRDDADTLFGSTDIASYTGQWVHAVATFNNGNGEIFLNGVSDGTLSSFPTGNLPNNTDAVYIGNQPTSTSSAPDGRIAEVALWSRVLSGNEIAALARRVSPARFSSGLEGYWPLLGQGSTEPDYSGKVRNGSVTGATQIAHVPVQPPFGGIVAIGGGGAAGGGPSAALTGTITASTTESDIVTGGKTIVLTLTGDTYVATASTPSFTGATSTGTNSGDGRTGNGDITVGFPAGYTPASGDLGVIVLYSDQGSGSTPTNWSQVTGSPFGAGTEQLNVFYKALAGGDSAPVTTISGSGTNLSHVAAMAVYTGISGIGAIGTASNGTGTPMSAAGVTTTRADSIVVFCCGRGDNEVAGNQTFNSDATGVNERFDSGTNLGNDSQVSLADKAYTTSGTATGTASSDTSVTDPWVGVVIELVRPLGFQDARQAIIDGIDSAQSETYGWDAVVKAGQTTSGVVRTSDTVCTITLDAFASYDINAQETITATIPASALSGASPIVASPSFTVDTAATTYTYVPASTQLSLAGTPALARTWARDGSGTITLAGDAPRARTFVPTTTGELALAGTAPTSLSWTYEYSGSGEIALSGSSVIARTYAPSTSGELALSGSSAIARTYAPTTTGELALAGTPALARTWAPTTTGELALAGDAPRARTYVPSTAGELALAGTAPTFLAKTYEYVPSTTEIAFAGTAAIARTYVPSTSGELALAGDAPRARTWSPTTTGEIALAGDAPRTRTFAPTTTGEVAFAGTATTLYVPAGGGTTYTYTPVSTEIAFSGSPAVARTWAPATSGELALAGAPAIARTYAPSVSGEIALAGSAGITRTWSPTTTGEIALAGDAPVARAYAPSTSGELVLAGTAPINRTWARDGSGGVSLAGTASVARTIVAGASGEIAFAGTASTSYVPVGSGTTFIYAPGAAWIYFGGAAHVFGPERTVTVTSEGAILLGQDTGRGLGGRQRVS